MGRHRSTRTLRAWLLLSLLLLPMGARAKTVSTDDNAAKIVNLMRADSYNYLNTKSPTVWMIPFNGDHLKNIKVVVTVKDSTMVVFVTVAENQHLPVTTDFMRALLEQNHELDRVKVGYDREGDLSVRIDGNVRVMDAAELREIVNQVRNASDEIYGMIEPSLLQ
jgi:methyl-accepting chemotaxis protein